jgi:hypothetical protein
VTGTPLSHVAGVVLSRFGMCGPILATISSAIAAANPAINRIIAFRMLGSPDLRIETPSLFLAVGATARALLAAQAGMGCKTLATNAAIANISALHQTILRKDFTALKPLTEESEEFEWKKKQEEDSMSSLFFFHLKKMQKEEDTTLVAEPISDK